jgi:hypothetical protein
MDVDSQNEELANLHVDFAAREVDAACARDGRRDVLGGGNGGIDEIFVK